MAVAYFTMCILYDKVVYFVAINVNTSSVWYMNESALAALPNIFRYHHVHYIVPSISIRLYLPHYDNSCFNIYSIFLFLQMWFFDLLLQLIITIENKQGQDQVVCYYTFDELVCLTKMRNVTITIHMHAK